MPSDDILTGAIALSISLKNFDGTVVTEKQLNDKISIVSFIFTQCEGACPIMSENMSTLQERFASSSDIQFLSITTDPDYDTLDILNEYSSNYSNKNNWFFLRGDIIDVIELSEKGFFLSAERKNPFSDNSITSIISPLKKNQLFLLL